MRPEITLENYEEKRWELIEANSNLHCFVLKEPGMRLDAFLSELKAEYHQWCKGKNLYAIPVLADLALCESRLYKFCSRLPKRS